LNAVVNDDEDETDEAGLALGLEIVLLGTGGGLSPSSGLFGSLSLSP
jgi:hypothetical protein